MRAVWHLGEGEVTCASAGTVWEPGRATTDCGFTFGRSSGGAVSASVDVVYRLSWRSNVGDVGELGEVTRTTTFPLQVWEAQAVIE